MRQLGNQPTARSVQNPEGSTAGVERAVLVRRLTSPTRGRRQGQTVEMVIRSNGKKNYALLLQIKMFSVFKVWSTYFYEIRWVLKTYDRKNMSELRNCEELYKHLNLLQYRV
jgi:hypothetical protein